MIEWTEAWRRIETALRPLSPVSLAIDDALGLVLAEDITASENIPPFRASAMDGYAVIASDPAPERRVLGEQDAGQSLPFVVQPGTAVRIMTGAPLPAGADAVIPVEQTCETSGVVTLQAPVKPGASVRPAGQDVAHGDLVLQRGTPLGAAEIGLLAAVGHPQVLAHPRPRVAIMATGDELVPVDQTPGPGQLRDSNSHALMAAVRAAGCEALSLGHVRDDEDALRAAFESGLARADLVLSSGGVSMGTRDLIKPLLEALGTVHFGRVAIKPGKPLTFAQVRGLPVFGLPGFPVSSLVTFEMFIRPALRLLGGHRALYRPQVWAHLAHPIRHAPDRLEFQRAVLTADDAGWLATVTGDQVSGRLKSLVGANALLMLPAGVAEFAQGEQVRAVCITMPEVEQAE
jgi:molybdenum cofactor synthesis domain-containing protein